MDRDMSIKLNDTLTAIKTALTAIKTAVETIAVNTTPADTEQANVETRTVKK